MPLGAQPRERVEGRSTDFDADDLARGLRREARANHAAMRLGSGSGGECAPTPLTTRHTIQPRGTCVLHRR